MSWIPTSFYRHVEETRFLMVLENGSIKVLFFSFFPLKRRKESHHTLRGMWDPSSTTKDPTCAPTLEARSLIYWTAKVVPKLLFSMLLEVQPEVGTQRTFFPCVYSPIYSKLKQRRSSFLFYRSSEKFHSMFSGEVNNKR